MVTALSAPWFLVGRTHRDLARGARSGSWPLSCAQWTATHAFCSGQDGTQSSWALWGKGQFCTRDSRNMAAFWGTDRTNSVMFMKPQPTSWDTKYSLAPRLLLLLPSLQAHENALSNRKLYHRLTEPHGWNSHTEHRHGGQGAVAATWQLLIKGQNGLPFTLHAVVTALLGWAPDTANFTIRSHKPAHAQGTQHGPFFHSKWEGTSFHPETPGRKRSVDRADPGQTSKMGTWSGTAA
jgi:hypothetical protein